MINESSHCGSSIDISGQTSSLSRASSNKRILPFLSLSYVHVYKLGKEIPSSSGRLSSCVMSSETQIQVMGSSVPQPNR